MIYLDHNATTPLRRCARAAMGPWLEGEFGNASSAHRAGARARRAVEKARSQLAAAIGAHVNEILFTSGGTESNNLALFGLVENGPPRRLLVSPIEHASVIEPVHELARRGAEVVWLEVDRAGRVDPADLARLLSGRPALVSVGWANNEIGTVQKVAEIARVCQDAGAILHVDAAQALGKVALSVRGVDTCSFSAHKIGGPQGAGALFVRRDLSLRPLLFGGGQEREMRPGTENVAALVGFGAAAAAATVEDTGDQVERLREQLWQGLARSSAVERISPKGGGLPNTLSVRFPGVAADAMVAALDIEGIAVSAGSACSSGAVEPSHVALALGYGRRAAREVVRFSLGSENTAAEIEATISAVGRVLQRVVPAVSGKRWAVPAPMG